MAQSKNNTPKEKVIVKAWRRLKSTIAKITSEQIVAGCTLFLAIATYSLAVETKSLVEDGKKQREDFRSSANNEFVYKFQTDMTTANFRKLVILLDMNMLIFISDPSNEDTLSKIAQRYPGVLPNGFPVGFAKKFPNSFPIFWIDKRFRGIEEVNDSNKDFISSYEMDDYVLSPMDNLGLYFNNNVIRDTEYVSVNFGWYMNLIWESKPVKEYVFWLRSYYVSEAAHLHNIEKMYFAVRRYGYNVKKNRNFDFIDDTITFGSNQIRCKDEKIIRSTIREVSLQHEGPK